MPKSRGEELNAMRHGPELHDALMKSQSVGPKSSTNKSGNQSSSTDVQPVVTRQTQSTHIPEHGGSVHGGQGLLTNGTVAMNPTEQQRLHGLGVLQQQNLISDSGYWSPKNNNISDYQVPTTRPPNLQHSVSIASRPMMPPPAPPPPAAERPQMMADQDRLLGNTGHTVARPASGMSSALPTRTTPNRDSLPPPPPAPSPMLESRQSTVNDQSLQRQPTPPAALDALDPNVDGNLPLPPMPPPCDDLPPGPPSPGLPAVPSLYPPPDVMAESPLPLPPEDVQFNMMVVPPPPPPLMEPEQMASKLRNGEVSSGGDEDKLDRLQADSASLSSEASSQATKSVNEDTGSEMVPVPEAAAPVRDKRSDLLDAIRKGHYIACYFLKHFYTKIHTLRLESFYRFNFDIHEKILIIFSRNER